MQRVAAFIDRDGVINKLIDRGDTFRVGTKVIRFTAPFVLSEVELLPRVREAIELFIEKGYVPIVVTNQPDVTRGHIEEREFERIMAVFRELPVHDIFACKHVPESGCSCHKPEPGLLHMAAELHDICLDRSVMIGDRETDVRAGKAAGVFTTIRLVDPSTCDDSSTLADHTVADLYEAALLLPTAPCCD